MHKDTLANIVIKAVRLANSVIDSSYEFPETNIDVTKELAFRENVLNYCKACHDGGKVEERAGYMRNILEYAASLQANDDYGKRLPEVIKAVRRCRFSTWAVWGLLYASLGGPLFEMKALGNLPLFWYGSLPLAGLIGGGNLAYDRIWKKFHGKPLDKKLVDEYYDYSLQKDTAEELRQVTQKEFNEAMFEHWDGLSVAFEDIENCAEYREMR